MAANIFHEILKKDYDKWKDQEHFFELENGSYRALTLGDFITRVNRLSAYLIDNGFKGRNIGVYSPNSIAWITIDTAVMTYVGMTVGISKDWQSDDLSYAIGKFDVACLFYSNELKANVDLIRADHPGVRFISIEDEFEEILSSVDVPLFTIEPKDPDEPAKMVFTSGTTSFPKGCMLSINNMFASYEGLGKRVPLTPEDSCYLFLPLNHTYATVFNYLYSFVFGYGVYLCHDIRSMAQEMALCKPTAFCGVPIVFERFKDAATKMNVPIKALLGGRLKYLFSGGAAITPELRYAFTSEGICLMNSYGLSETASAFAIDYPDNTDLRSSGTIMENLDAKVMDPDEEGYGELALKGPNVFKGYYGDPEATSRAFSPDGYYLTGDIGTIRNNKVYIRGRKDTMVTLSNGENVASEKIASKVRELSPSITSVKVYVRDGRLCCNIFANEKIDIDPLIAELNTRLPKYEKICSYKLIDSRKLMK